jgi:hypothetical protein
MSHRKLNRRKRQWSKSLCATALAFSMLAYVPAGYSNEDHSRGGHHSETANPIKHVIIIVGENRSFDHVFATDVPKHEGERVRKLLSGGIINADGTPGKNFSKAHPFQVTAAPNGGKYFISASDRDKILYATLPPPGQS